MGSKECCCDHRLGNGSFVNVVNAEKGQTHKSVRSIQEISKAKTFVADGDSKKV